MLIWEPVHERPSREAAFVRHARAALSVGLACSRTTQYAPRARPPSALHLAIPEQAPSPAYSDRLAMGMHAPNSVMTTAHYIELGVLYAKEGRYHDAYKPLRQALTSYGEQNVKDVPFVLLSYYGLCLVAMEREVDRGLGFCR